MIDRLIWLFLRRFLLRFKFRGFCASMNSYASSDVEFSEFNSLRSGAHVKKSRIGRYSYISGAKVVNSDIGAFCSVGPGALVGGLGRHPLSYVSTHPIFYSPFRQVEDELPIVAIDFDELPRTYVGNDVWIGARAVVLDGVRVGDGAVIAAGAVVVSDVPEYAIVGGVPAKVIRYRCEPESIEKLRSISWWKWSRGQIVDDVNLFRRSPEEFLEIVSKRCNSGSVRI